MYSIGFLRRYFVVVAPDGTDLQIKVQKGRYIYKVSMFHHSVHPDMLFPGK